jgi:uncharacterized DUF497 family protein
MALAARFAMTVRSITIGLLVSTVILMAHAETENTIRIIHARKADKTTARRYFAHFGD